MTALQFPPTKKKNPFTICTFSHNMIPYPRTPNFTHMGGITIIYRSRDTLISILGAGFESTYGAYVRRDLIDASRYILAYDATVLATDFPDATDTRRVLLTRLLAADGSVATSPVTPVSAPIAPTPAPLAAAPAPTPTVPTVSAMPTPTALASSAPSLAGALVSSAIAEVASAIAAAPALTATPSTSGFSINQQIFTSFAGTQVAIQNLLKIKNPISWLIQVNRIKDDIAQGLEDLADTLSTQFETSDQSEQVAFLVYLGLGKQKSEDVMDLYQDSKYFDEGLYFTVYASTDRDFHHLIQKLASKNPNVSDTKAILSDARFRRYAAFLDFFDREVRPLLPKGSEDFRPVRISGVEIAYLTGCVSAIVRRAGARASHLLEQFFGFFPLDTGAIHASRFHKDSTVIAYAQDHLTNRSTERILREHPELRRMIDTEVERYSAGYESSVDIRARIEHAIASEPQTTRDAVERSYQEQVQSRYYHSALSHRFIWNQIAAKVDEKRWMELRLNYRVRMRNDDTKQDIYKVMDSYNQFRRIILSVQDSSLSDVIKSFIYRFLAEKVSLDPKAYKYLKYFLLFVLPRTYAEYSRIFTFFYEYEAYKSGKRFRISLFVLTATTLVVASIGAFYSVLLMAGIACYLLGTYAKRENFFARTPTLRFHGGFQLVGMAIILVYTLLLLNQNGYIEFRTQLSLERDSTVAKAMYYTLRDVPYQRLPDVTERMTASIRDSLRSVAHSSSGTCDVRK